MCIRDRDIAQDSRQIRSKEDVYLCTDILEEMEIEEEINSGDDAAKEMMEQLKKESNAYVNPQTGKAVRWGDTWRHAWGGGVGGPPPGAPPPRFAAGGPPRVQPAPPGKGGADFEESIFISCQFSSYLPRKFAFSARSAKMMPDLIFSDMLVCLSLIHI